MSHIIFCQTRWRKPVPKRISCILNFREKLMPNFLVKIRLIFFKDGYRATVKISLCICVVLSRDELKVRQNLPDSDYRIYMVCLLVATFNWHKSLQFVKKIEHSTLTLFIYDFISRFDYYKSNIILSRLLINRVDIFLFIIYNVRQRNRPRNKGTINCV